MPAELWKVAELDAVARRYGVLPSQVTLTDYRAFLLLRAGKLA